MPLGAGVFRACNILPCANFADIVNFMNFALAKKER
jgi:hypothetical protein